MKDDESKAKTQKTIHLFISLPTEDVCSLRDVNTSMLVHQLKSKVELKVGIPGDLIHLFFMNRELEEGKPLMEYKLRHGCILRVRLHRTWMGLFLSCWKGDLFEVFNNGVQKMEKGVHNKELDVDLWNKLVVKRATFALFMATHRGYLSLMLELLNSSAADINGCTIFGRTSLHIAAFQGFVGCVSLLLSEGASSNVADIFGKTALQLAYINRHTYCQKRLYLHQTSGADGLKSRRKNVEETEPRDHSPSKIRYKDRNVIGEFARSSKLENDKTTYPTQGSSTPSKSLPNIPVGPQHNPPPPVISEDQPLACGLPAVKIIEHPDHHQSAEEEGGSHCAYPDLHPSVSAAGAKLDHSKDVDNSKNRERRLPKGIRGIENILKTSQDDVIGEYHNIEESLADVNVTTLVLSPSTEGTGQKVFAGDRRNEKTLNRVNDDGEVVETLPRNQTPLQHKRILGFVLKAEQNNCETQPVRLEHDPESKAPDRDDGVDERMWYSSPCTEIYHNRLTSSLSFDEWLQKKKESQKQAINERPKSATITEKTKFGREMDDDAFQKWLNNKKKLRRRRACEMSPTEINKSSSGVSFEIWLSQKRQRQQSFPVCDDTTSEKREPRPKTVNLGGKTFAQWLSEKRNKWQNDNSPENSENKRTRSHSGKSFQKWLKDKKKERHKELAQRETSEIKMLQEKAYFEEQRRLNPRVKTFEEWIEEKRVHRLIEYVRTRNAPDEPTLLNSQVKFQEDAELVYEMWLTAKHMDELSKEDELYEEMKEKWRRKEEQRLQVRSGILRKPKQMKKYTNNKAITLWETLPKGKGSSS